MINFIKNIFYRIKSRVTFYYDNFLVIRAINKAKKGEKW